MKLIVYILYDSINNSVFQGQVLTPLLKKIGQRQRLVLISFESSITQEQHIALQQQLGRHQFIVLRRLPFLGRISLWHSRAQLKPILAGLPNHKIIARGPLAGWIAQQSLQKNCSSLLIQARGVLAEEYAYAHHKNVITFGWHHWREHELRAIEQTIYNHPHIRYETVSHALKDFLIERYGTDQQNITLANDDIPSALPRDIGKAWRISIRTELNIPEQWTVYCYNGSLKAWQCPDRVISFFKTQYTHNKESLLLIVSQNKAAFEALLTQHKLPLANYRVLSIPHQDIYRFLAAADYGLLFRETSVVNWVSRPTKALEYRAVGLKIIHNNTVAWLAHEESIPWGDGYVCSC